MLLSVEHISTPGNLLLLLYFMCLFPLEIRSRLIFVSSLLRNNPLNIHPLEYYMEIR